MKLYLRYGDACSNRVYTLYIEPLGLEVFTKLP